jgi:N-acetyl sugar amidotransferase
MELMNNNTLENLRWCSNCLTMSTRPRITFDVNGKCNACRWVEEKSKIDWENRSIELEQLVNQHRKSSGDFDCLVPMSGGKDGSYVAHMLKTHLGMNPLGITITPALPTELGEQNLRSFVKSGYNHLSINPDYNAMRFLNREGFMKMGFPYYGWLVSINAAPIRIAQMFGINLIFYGEDGEVEYGGSTETLRNPIYDIDYQKRVYLEDGYQKVINDSGLNPEQLIFFKFPDEPTSGIKLTHWSYFENWDPYRNYLVAKEHFGLKESETTNSGTFTNFSQNDQKLYALHTYMMYLKFGFGRANQDACIEVRRGAMDRSQAINLVRLYDGQYPEEFLSDYLEYYQISKSEFDEVLDTYANKDLFEKIDGRWWPMFEIM